MRYLAILALLVGCGRPQQPYEAEKTTGTVVVLEEGPLIGSGRYYVLQDTNGTKYLFVGAHYQGGLTVMPEGERK